MSGRSRSGGRGFCRLVNCKDCGKPTKGHWDCCGHCGVELKAGRRRDPDTCEHEIEIVAPRCIHCGFKSSMGILTDGPWYWMVSVGAAGVGGFLVRMGGTMPDPTARVAVVFLGVGLFVYGIVQIFRGAGNVRVFP